jgi:putative membrane protein
MEVIDMMAWHWYAHDGLGPWLWIPWMVLFWGALLATGVYFMRRRPTTDAGPSAEEVLAERFARGEIDAEEYRRRQAVLRERRTRGRAS